MPKRAVKPKPSKSEAIRNHKKEFPTDGPKLISEALAKMGYKDVTAQYVSTVLCNDRRKRGLTQTGRVNVNRVPGELRAVDLKYVKDLVEQLGGVEEAKAAIDFYADLTGQ